MKIIGVSGAVCSGKSTWVNNIVASSDRVVKCQYNLSDLDKTLKIMSSIDSLRKNDLEYLMFQMESLIFNTISNTFYQENSEEYKDKIILQDRTPLDTIYYLTKYINKNKNEFYSYMVEKITEMFKHFSKNLYKLDYLLLFKPIEKNESCMVSTRPKEFDFKYQTEEFNEIKKMSKSIYNRDTIVLEENIGYYDNLILNLLNQ